MRTSLQTSVTEHLATLLKELSDVSVELGEVYEAIGETEAAEVQAKIEGFFASMARTVAEREKDASRNAKVYSVDLPKLRAARETLVIRRDLLLLRINLSKEADACL